MVEFHEAEEFAVAQSGQYPALNHQDCVFKLGLISGVRCPCCQQGAAVVGSKFFVQAVVLWVVVAQVLDQ